MSLAISARTRIVAGCSAVLFLVLSAYAFWTYTDNSSRRLEYGMAPPILADIDGDGLTDAISADPPKQGDGYPEPVTLTFFKNAGAGKLEKAAAWAVPGLVDDLRITDLDGDRALEILVVSGHRETQGYSIYVVTLPDWRLSVWERPGDHLGLCKIGNDGQLALDTGRGVWVMENGSLVGLLGLDPGGDFRAADFDSDGSDEFVSWQTVNGSSIHARAFAYRDGRLQLESELFDEAELGSPGTFRFSPDLYMNSDSIVRAGGRFISDRPVLLFNQSGQERGDPGAVQSEFPAHATYFKGRAVFWDADSGKLAAADANVCFVDGSSDNTNRATGDLNGDGFPDVVVMGEFRNGITVYRSLLSGGVLSYERQYIGLSGEPVFYLEDLCGDHQLDLAAIDFGDLKIKLFQNDGSGHFAPVWTIPFPAGSSGHEVQTGWSLRFSDQNGDGRKDLIAVNSAPDGSFTVFSGEGGSAFSAGRSYSWGTYPGNAESLFDPTPYMDSDGRRDVVFSSDSLGATVVLLNDGQGRFPDARAMPAVELEILGAIAAFLFVVPMLWPERARWYGILAARLGLSLAFIGWLLQWPTGPGLGPLALLGLLVLFVPALLCVPLAAIAGRPSPWRFAGVLLASAWFFLVVSFWAGTVVRPNAVAGGITGYLVEQGPFVVPVFAVLAALSFFGTKNFRDHYPGPGPACRVTPELAEHLENFSLRVFPSYTGSRAYLVSENPWELVTVRRVIGLQATLDLKDGDRIVPGDPAPVLARLELERPARENPPDGREPKELGQALADASVRKEPGRLMGGVMHYDLPMLLLFIGMYCASLLAWAAYGWYYGAYTSMAFLVSTAAVIALLFSVNYRSSTRVYENAIDHWGLFGFKRAWLADIRAVRPMRRFLYGRLGPVYDVARPSHYQVETADGKRFHVSGESALLLRQALGPLWTATLDDSAFIDHFKRKTGPVKLRAPSRYFGFITGAVIAGIFWATLFATILAGSFAYPALTLVLIAVPLAGMILGALAVRTLLDRHLGRVFAAKLALAGERMSGPGAIREPLAGRLRRAADIAVVRRLPARLPARLEITGIASTRGALAVVIAALLLVPVLGTGPPAAENRHTPMGFALPEWPEFLNVTGDRVLEGRALNITGDVVVGGNLSILNCTFSMNGRFRVGGNLTIAGSNISGEPTNEAVYGCSRGDAALMLVLDLTERSRANLSFHARYELSGAARALLTQDGLLLWNGSASSDGWQSVSVDIGALCGRYVVLRLRPTGWNAASHLLVYGFRLETDQGERRLNSFGDISSHGFNEVRQNNGLTISASNSTVRIIDSGFRFQDSELAFELDNATMEMSGSRLDGPMGTGNIDSVRSVINISGSAMNDMTMNIDRGRLWMRGCDASAAGNLLTAVDASIRLEQCNLSLGFSGMTLTNVAGVLRGNHVTSSGPVVITPPDGPACRLADSLDISGNRLGSGLEFHDRNRPAFELRSSIPVADAADLALRNELEYDWVFVRKAGLAPRVHDTSGEPVDSTIYARTAWLVEPRNITPVPLPFGQSAGMWDNLGNTFFNRWSPAPGTRWDRYDYRGSGFEVEWLRRTPDGLDRYLPANSSVEFLADAFRALAYGRGDPSGLSTVGERLILNLTVQNGCDVGLGNPDVYYDGETRSLACSYNLDFWGNASTADVVFRYSGGLSDSARVSQENGRSGRPLLLPLEDLTGNGTLELSVSTGDSPDMDPTNDRKAWPVEVLSGNRTLSGMVESPALWVLDGANISVENCTLDFQAPECRMFDNGRGSNISIRNSTVNFTSLEIIGNINGTAECSRFFGNGSIDGEGYSFIYIDSGAWTFGDSTFGTTSDRVLVAYLYGNPSLRNISLSRCYLTAAIVNLTGCTFRDCSWMNFDIGGNSTFSGCLFSNSSFVLHMADHGVGSTYANNTLSNGSTAEFEGPVDLDSVASNFTISDGLNDSIYLLRWCNITLAPGWLLNRTTERIVDIMMEYSSLDGNQTTQFQPQYSQLNVSWTAYLYITVASLNWTGRHVLTELPYIMSIITMEGDVVEYIGTLNIGKDYPLDIRLE